MTLPSFSNRLGHIPPEKFQQALIHFSLGHYIQAEAIPHGLFGQNVFLTSSKGEYVFRGAPHYSWQFPTERFFTDILHERTKTPVPYPYLHEPDPSLIGWDYVIMPRLPGLYVHDPAIKAQLTVHEQLEINRAVAQMLIEIQTLNWDCSGSFRPETGKVGSFDSGYRQRVIQNIHEKVESSCACNANTTHTDLKYIESILKKTGCCLDIPFQPTVVLGDYGEHNLVVANSGGHWRVSGVFDLMTAHFGDGAADLSCPVFGYIKNDVRYADAFVEEYLLQKSVSKGFAALQQLYMLDLTLSFWKYFQKHEGGMPGDET